MRREAGLGSVLLLAATLAVGVPPSARAAARTAPASAKLSEAAPASVGDDDAAADEVEQDDEARKQAALELFQHARQLYLDGEYAAAAREFRRSFDTLPSLEALVAAARAHAAAGDLLAGLDTYREYLSFEDDDAHRHQEALEHYRELRLQVGEIALRVERPETIRAITLNGEAVELRDFPRQLVPGPIVLEIQREGLDTPRVIRAEVHGGETTVIELPAPARVATVVETAPPPIEPPTEPPLRPPSPGLRIVFWSGVALSGVAALSMATLGGLTMREKRRFEEGLCSNIDGGGCADGASYPHVAERRFAELRLATNIVVGVGAGIAVATLAIGLSLKRRRDAKVALGPAPGGLTLRF
ncbi:MAG: hypothetical protein H6710_05880 [Myxococcales bacterium]|nr:hypothetical protein [Myxococcales bacterium]